MPYSITLAAGDLTRILVVLQYVSICPLLWWWLVRQLPRSYRLLLGCVLAVQILLVAFGLFYNPPTAFDEWLVDLEGEWNLTSILGSTQLALVGIGALMNGWLARRRNVWQRLYLLAIGLLFIALGLQEYFAQSSYLVFMNEWYVPYTVFGSLLMVITVVFVETSPKQPRLWLLYVFAALFILALGGFVFDGLVRVCHDFLGVFRIDGCFKRAYLEETLEMLGSWVAFVAILGQFSFDIPAASRRATALLVLSAPAWILFLVTSSAIPPVSVPWRSNHAEIVWDTGAGLHAYSIGTGDTDLSMQLYMSPAGREFDQLGYSVQLVDIENGDVLARTDRRARQDLKFRIGPGYVPVFRQWAPMPLPPDIPTQKALGIWLSLWRIDDGAFLPLKVTSSDHPRVGDTHVLLREIVFPKRSEEPPGDVYAQFANGFALAPVDLPARARAGEVLTVPFTWSATKSDDVEYIQFMHFFHEETGEWWVWDAQPLGSRLPTRLWYKGLVDTETWSVPLGETVAPGRYTVFTGLYRVEDMERLPANRADGTPFVDARLPLGALTVIPAD